MSTNIHNTGNIMKFVYEPSSESLRVNLIGSGTPTLPNAVRLTDGTGFLTSTVAGAYRALDVNIINDLEIILDHADDSVKLGDGINLFTSTNIASKYGLDVNIINTDYAKDATLQSILSALGTLSVDVNNFPADLATETTLQDVLTSINNIDSSLSGTITVSDLNANKDDVMIAGSVDGTATGTVKHFVNNTRQQILASHDREEAITYLDFGTKNERITRVDYTSATFPGITARKDITYTLTSGKYRRDEINWSLV